MAISIAERLAQTTVSCNEILNAGSIILVSLLPNCTNEPTLYTLTLDNAVTEGDETVSLTCDIAGGVRLREGSVLYFGSDTLVVAAEVLADTATPVIIEPAEAAIAAAETAQTWGLLKLLSPTNIPLNIEANTVDRTDLTSFQGSMVKTQNNYKPQISCIANLKDRALYDIIFDSANSTVDVYANIVYNSTQLGFGRALVSGFNSDGNVAEIQRPQFTLEFQGKDYRVTKPFLYESTENQGLINEAMRLSGLELFTV